MVHRFPLSFRLAVLLLTLAVLPVVALAGPPPDCTCEFCLENIDAKCRPPGGGVASCSSLIRSGVCLGLFSDTVTAVSESSQAACAEEALESEPQPLGTGETGAETQPDLG